MKPKKLEKKKPFNKWKITAIISLVINGLVAVLLAVGLAQPKTQKTSALGTGGDYIAYINSNDISPMDNTWSLFENLSWSWVTPTSTGVNSVYYTGDNVVILDYLDSNIYARRFELIFTYINEDTSYSSEYCYLSGIRLTTSSSSSGYHSIFNATWLVTPTQQLQRSYGTLGLTSPYIFIKKTDTFLIGLFDRFFIRLGSNEIVSDFEISDNWNPNKYISLVTDSIGLLYDTPSAVTGGVIDQIKGVVWSNPFYDGITSTSQPYGVGVSSLGFLEIPLLFTSNGENFIGIRIYYDVVQKYVDKNNEVQSFDYGSSYNSHLFHFTFVYMSYVYELSNYYGSANYYWKEKVVCALPVYRTLVSYIDSNTWKRNFIYEVYQPYNWLSDNYKTISVYEASTPYLNRVGFSESLNTRSLAINNLTIRQILEYDMTQNDYGVNTSGYVGIGNVFILIGDAFSAVMPLLAVTIVPGLTIGMLLFIPVVLTIIIVVIKLVKR